MKTKIFLLASIAAVCSCSPDQIELRDFSNYEVAKVVCQAPSDYLVADNLSELALEVRIFVKTGTYTDKYGQEMVTYGEVAPERYRDHEVKFFLEDGTQVTTPYKTSSSAAATLKFYATVDGIRSTKSPEQLLDEYPAPKAGDPLATNPPVNVDKDIFFPINVREPLPEQAVKRFAVVFHVFQTTEDVKVQKTLKYETFERVIAHWNAVFMREQDRASNGANPKLQFVLAKVDYEGAVMKEPGVNRITMSAADLTTINNSFPASILSRKEMYWDCDRYLNVWVYERAIPLYHNSEYIAPNTFKTGDWDATAFPKPFSTEYDDRFQELDDAGWAAWKANPEHLWNVGLHYKPGTLGSMSGYPSDIIQQPAAFFGVIQTGPQNNDAKFKKNGVWLDDHCEDTPKYNRWFASVANAGKQLQAYGSEVTKYTVAAPWIKYKSTNVMEYTSLCTTVSQDQVRRINWATQHAFARQAWRNTTAID